MKIIGILIIIFSSVMIASILAEKTDSTLRAVIALRAILEHTKSMIDCYSLSVSEILCRVDSSLFSDCGYLKDMPPRDFESFIRNSKIDDSEACEIFSSFADGFGKSYRQDELSRCSIYLEKMRSREQKVIKESAKKKKVIFTVVISASLTVIILVI